MKKYLLTCEDLSHLGCMGLEYTSVLFEKEFETLERAKKFAENFRYLSEVKEFVKQLGALQPKRYSHEWKKKDTFFYPDSPNDLTVDLGGIGFEITELNKAEQV